MSRAFELTRQLLPALQRGAPSRVVTVSSAAQRRKEIVLDDLQNVRRRYGGVRVYGETKLMNVLFTRELARRMAGTGVTAHLLPSRRHRHRRPAQLPAGDPAPDRRGVQRHARSGADTPIWLATSPAVEGATGGYYIRRHLARPNPRANDRELARQFWSASEELASRGIN